MNLVSTGALHAFAVQIEIGVEVGRANNGGGVVNRVGGRETLRGQAVVFEVGMCAFQNGGDIAVHIPEDQFVNHHIVLIGDDVMVGLPIGILLA